jgi:uroporphyrin-III C-methyltransferase
VTNLPEIVEALIGGGLPGSTPALVVHGATTARERVVEATLERLPGLARDGTIRSPAVVAIGAIAPFRAAIANHLLEFGAEAAQ